jgi:arylsulfatase A-like enzyme
MRSARFSTSAKKRLSSCSRCSVSRQVEVYAAYAAYSHYELGSVIQAFEDLCRLDNTLVIYINGDNGTSA